MQHFYAAFAPDRERGPLRRGARGRPAGLRRDPLHQALRPLLAPGRRSRSPIPAPRTPPDESRTCPSTRARSWRALRPWVECESPTHDAAAVNRMMGVAARDLAVAGARVETIPGRMGLSDCVRARFPHPGPRRPGILVLGHLDTVHPVGTLASLPWRIEGDRAYGPGILDMKGGNVIALAAIRALAAAGIETPLPGHRAVHRRRGGRQPLDPRPDRGRGRPPRLRAGAGARPARERRGHGPLRHRAVRSGGRGPPEPCRRLAPRRGARRSAPWRGRSWPSTRMSDADCTFSTGIVSGRPVGELRPDAVHAVRRSAWPSARPTSTAASRGCWPSSGEAGRRPLHGDPGRHPARSGSRMPAAIALYERARRLSAGAGPDPAPSQRRRRLGRQLHRRQRHPDARRPRAARPGLPHPRRARADRDAAPSGRGCSRPCCWRSAGPDRACPEGAVAHPRGRTAGTVLVRASSAACVFPRRAVHPKQCPAGSVVRSEPMTSGGPTAACRGAARLVRDDTSRTRRDPTG